MTRRHCDTNSESTRCALLLLALLAVGLTACGDDSGPTSDASVATDGGVLDGPERLDGPLPDATNQQPYCSTSPKGSSNVSYVHHTGASSFFLSDTAQFTVTYNPNDGSSMDKTADAIWTISNCTNSDCIIPFDQSDNVSGFFPPITNYNYPGLFIVNRDNPVDGCTCTISATLDGIPCEPLSLSASTLTAQMATVVDYTLHPLQESCLYPSITQFSMAIGTAMDFFGCAHYSNGVVVPMDHHLVDGNGETGASWSSTNTNLAEVAASSGSDPMGPTPEGGGFVKAKQIGTVIIESTYMGITKSIVLVIGSWSIFSVNIEGRNTSAKGCSLFGTGAYPAGDFEICEIPGSRQIYDIWGDRSDGQKQHLNSMLYLNGNSTLTCSPCNASFGSLEHEVWYAVGDSNYGVTLNASILPVGASTPITGSVDIGVAGGHTVSPTLMIKPFPSSTLPVTIPGLGILNNSVLYAMAEVTIPLGTLEVDVGTPWIVYPDTTLDCVSPDALLIYGPDIYFMRAIVQRKAVAATTVCAVKVWFDGDIDGPTQKTFQPIYSGSSALSGMTGITINP